MKRGIDMFAGLPGTGIGGIYYLLIALWMPIREISQRIRKKGYPSRLRFITRHVGLTLSTILAMWTTGEFLGILLLSLSPGMMADLASKTGVEANNILGVSPFLIAIGTLSMVYISLHILRYFTTKRVVLKEHPTLAECRFSDHDRIVR
jgi:hypothetical protein